MNLPTDPHELALWLLDNLEQARAVGSGGLWQGVLPAQLDFSAFDAHFDQHASPVVGFRHASDRMIEFYPSSGDVYQNMQELLGVANNRRRIPGRFHVQSPIYSHPATAGQDVPAVIQHYFDAIHVWSALRDSADVQNGSLLFVNSHDAQVEIMPDFGETDLQALAGLGDFLGEFGRPVSHVSQKKSIIRNELIDLFKPDRQARMSALLAKFDTFAMKTRQSLAMYMAEFSVAKVKGEVERQNLDDTVSLNKTLSDIQNQLLALPAAILLAGATIKAGETLRNYAVLAGVCIFVIFILILVSNQMNTVNAIGAQLSRRKQKVEMMPTDSAGEVLPLFASIEQRVRRQKVTLRFIAFVVIAVLVASIWAVLVVNADSAFMSPSVSVSLVPSLDHPAASCGM